MTKESLREYKWLRKSIETLKSEIEFLRDKIDIKSPSWSDMPGCKSHEHDKMATIVAQVVDEQYKLYELVNIATTRLSDIEFAIESLPEREKVLIRYRYIDDLKWEEICVKMHYSFQMIHKLHSKALAMLRKL